MPDKLDEVTVGRITSEVRQELRDVCINIMASIQGEFPSVKLADIADVVIAEMKRIATEAETHTIRALYLTTI